MPSQEEIADQQELLTAYRRTLAQYRKQEALSGEAFVPPAVTNGIQEARAEIRRVKATLRGWDVAIDDHPDDQELPQSLDAVSARAVRRLWRMPPAGWASLAGALLVLIIGVMVWQAPRPAMVAPTAAPATVVPATVGATVVAPTAAPVPVFVVRYAFDPQQLERVELVPDTTLAATIPITDFLTVSSVEFGSFEATNEPAWNIRFQLTNTSAQPIMLDLNQRFFVLNDNQGRAASLAYFCCATQPGDLLAPGERREIQLLYRSVDGWYGKATAAHTIFIRVTGLLPVVRAVWSFPTLATAN
ncbi:MAG: hypothetical protein M3R61_00325 [Chloroflexota bacterium]|nr:hypothetical protein [Chloroflexota bacterium]